MVLKDFQKPFLMAKLKLKNEAMKHLKSYWFTLNVVRKFTRHALNAHGLVKS